ncbi:MAG: hypothetical protein ACR2PH_18235 [Desulfobulbia bacterium]
MARPWNELQNVDTFRCYHLLYIPAGQKRNLFLPFDLPRPPRYDGMEYAWNLDLELLQTIGGLYRVTSTSTLNLIDPGTPIRFGQLNARAPVTPYFGFYTDCQFDYIPFYIPLQFFIGDNLNNNSRVEVREYPRKTSSIILEGTQVIVEYENISSNDGYVNVSLLIEQTNVDMAKHRPQGSTYL